MWFWVICFTRALRREEKVPQEKVPITVCIISKPNQPFHKQDLTRFLKVMLGSNYWQHFECADKLYAEKSSITKLEPQGLERSFPHVMFIKGCKNIHLRSSRRNAVELAQAFLKDVDICVCDFRLASPQYSAQSWREPCVMWKTCYPTIYPDRPWLWHLLHVSIWKSKIENSELKTQQFASNVRLFLNITYISKVYAKNQDGGFSYKSPHWGVGIGRSLRLFSSAQQK